MRKYRNIGLIAVGMVFVLTSLAIFFISCRKEADCRAIITVRLLKGTDDSQVVPGCTVTFGEVGYSDSVFFVGVTDANGKIDHTWRNEAKLKAVAQNGDRMGVAMITLVKGETVEQDILIPVN